MEKEIIEINKDLYEVESLMTIAKRRRIKNFLSIELRRLISEKQKLEESFRNEKTTKSNNISTPNENSFQVRIDNYAWDQTPKYIKFFITLPKVHQLDSENIECQFGTDSLTLVVKNLEKRHFVFNIVKLLHSVIPEKSFWEVKSDTLIIFLVKTNALKWRYLTKSDEEKVQERKNKYTAGKTEKHNEDSLFTLMKNMYEKGDDQLKRTIAQAWTEGHSSQ